MQSGLKPYSVLVPHIPNYTGHVREYTPTVPPTPVALTNCMRLTGKQGGISG